jgi:hypothetical protein
MIIVSVSTIPERWWEALTRLEVISMPSSPVLMVKE